MRPDVDAAIAVLARGGLIGLPTETVYGLAADASNEAALRRVFAVKGRPADHPLIVHVADLDAAAHVADLGAHRADAAALAARFWPGPLTLVLPAGPHVSHVVTGGRPTVAVRVPAHPLARAVLAGFGRGVAAPSANRYGRVSPTTAAHVRADLGDDVDLVLDGGPSEVGIESTILDLTTEPPTLLRPGAIPVAALEAALGRAVQTHDVGAVRAPGMHAAHYAPRAEVVLVGRDEARVAAEADRADGRPAGAAVLRDAADAADATTLPLGADVDEVARRLYAALRRADELGLARLYVELPEGEGIASAVRDRLGRAAVGSRRA